MTVLASFHKEHLEYHGVKSNHIQSSEVDCINFKELIEQYNFQKLDLLVVDTEGHDDVLITNFIQNTDIRPIIILEWIHIKKNKVEELIELLKSNNYKFLKFNKDLICIQNNELFVLAGLWDRWVDRGVGKIINSVTILTKEASGIMKYLHNSKLRQPIIMDYQTGFKWNHFDNYQEILNDVKNINLKYYPI